MDKLVELWIRAIDEREIEEYSKEVRDLCDYTMYLAKKLNQLETNWNKLKMWLKANDIHYAEAVPFRETLKKMQELEGGFNEW